MRGLAIAFTLMCSSAWAQVLTAGDVQTSVLANFALIQESHLKASASAATATSANGEFDTKLKAKSSNRIDEQYDYRILETSLEKRIPSTSLKVFTGYAQALGNIPAYTGRYETGSAGEAFVGLQLPLLRDRSIDEARFQLLNAELERKMASLDLTIKKNFYVYKGLSAFEKWRLAYSKHQIKQTVLRIANERQVMLDKRVRAGDLERIKLIDNQRSVDKRNEERLAAELELAMAQLNLGLYYRPTSDGSVNLKTFTPSARSVAVARKDEFRIEFQRLPQAGLLDLEISSSRQAEKLNRSLALPDLVFDATAFQRFSKIRDYNPNRLQVGLQLEIPLENRKANGKSAAADFKAQAIEKRKAYLELEMQTSLEQLFETARLNAERALVIERELQGAQLMAEAERKKWQRGDTDLFLVAIREQEAADVEARLRTVEYEVAQAELDRKFLLNQFVED